jgi:hypothetical protein
MADKDPTPPPKKRATSGMSTVDLSQFANQAVDTPRRSEKWFAITLIVLVAFAVGIFFALR